jgi:hypothetical protein
MAVVFPDFASGIFATKKAGMDLTLEYFHVFHHVSFTHTQIFTYIYVEAFPYVFPCVSTYSHIMFPNKTRRIYPWRQDFAQRWTS